MVDPELVYELADRPSAVWLARQLFATWLADRRVPQGTAEDLLLVCSELCTDALRYSEGPVKLRARREDDEIVLEVDAVVAARRIRHRCGTGHRHQRRRAPCACLVRQAPGARHGGVDRCRERAAQRRRGKPADPAEP